MVTEAPAPRPRFPSDDADRFMIRMPQGMRDQLKRTARASNRTLNSEIIARLEASLEDRPVDGVGDLHRRMADTERRLDELHDRVSVVEGRRQETVFDASDEDAEPRRAVQIGGDGWPTGGD